MEKQSSLQRMVLSLSILAVFSLVLACSGGGDLPNQISGTWQRSEDAGIVEVDLVKDPPQLKVDGRIYAATITKVDEGANSVYLTVQTEDGKTEEWILHQMWNDNGSGFTLALIHNGVRAKLVSRNKS